MLDGSTYRINPAVLHGLPTKLPLEDFMYDPKIQELYELFRGRELTDDECEGLGTGSDKKEYQRIAFYAGFAAALNNRFNSTRSSSRIKQMLD